MVLDRRDEAATLQVVHIGSRRADAWQNEQPGIESGGLTDHTRAQIQPAQGVDHRR